MKKVVVADAGIDAAVCEAKEMLQHPGAVLMVPTETVYGLVCRADDAAAVDRIYAMKDRDRSKKMALFIYDWRRLSERGVLLSGLPEKLAERYCPGAITIIAPARGGETVGFRVPDHPFILALLRAIDFPLASTSANLSGHPNVMNVAAALAELQFPPDLALDGGEISADSLASTVVDATGKTIRIIRQGALRIEI